MFVSLDLLQGSVAKEQWSGSWPSVWVNSDLRELQLIFHIFKLRDPKNLLQQPCDNGMVELTAQKREGEDFWSNQNDNIKDVKAREKQYFKTMLGDNLVYSI